MPPNRSQEAYNARGRQSSAGKRKKGKAKKRKTVDSEHPDSLASGDVQDSNADILTPKSKEEKERERKEKLLRELQEHTDAKWTSKKKKRLEKYIEKKLKKEERVAIFGKLAQSQASLSSSVLQSSSTLGSGKALTHLERLEKLEDKEVKQALDGRIGKRKRRRDEFSVHDANGDEDESDDELPKEPYKYQNCGTAESPKHQKPEPKVIVDLSTSNCPPPPAKNVEVGSALQRNPDGSAVQPKVRKLSKSKQASKKGWGTRTTRQVAEESDTSFDSSDSAYDSTSEESQCDEEMEEGDQKSDSGSSEGEGEGEGDDEEERAESVERDPPKKRTLGFKQWAMKQLSVAKGYNLPPSDEVPTQETQATLELPSEPPKKRIKLDPSQPREMRGPLGEELALPSGGFAQHVLSAENRASTSSSYVKVVELKRPPEVEEARILLPIVTEEQPIMEAIMLNPVVVICGETGSGKTTQVPQFLYEAGFGTPGSENPGMIGITQPRRVAAMSMASRVAHELSFASSKVSYQIRYDATVSPSTSIKFMTDGVLLRELATDFLLTKYSVIIIDEAHERSINTDILVGVLSRVIKLREERWKEGKIGAKPLRLIIMSATLRVSDFAENKTLFLSPPPVISVGARQFPVTVHFSRRTSPDYVNEAIKKATKIHTRLPPGGILIFLTGQNEITGVCRKLEAKFSRRALEAKKRRRSEAASRAEEEQFDNGNRTANPAQAALEVEDIDFGLADEDDLAPDVDEGVIEEDPEALESDDDEDMEELGLDDTDVPMHIVPLYSLLPSEKQMRVFEPPPPGSRLVVVSTNVAETSLTIPGIRYVVDCGRAKERKYDMASGVQSFQITWTSKASAQQRAGRAGRTGPGHCYRLYSSALFEHHFDQFTQPEILRMPIEGVVLQMKSMHIDAVINFPFPTPPDRLALHKAEKILIHLGALLPDPTNTSTVVTGSITELGRAMALFPLSPRFSRMLVSGQQHGCLPYVISIVSALSVGDPFLYEEAISQDEAPDSSEDDDAESTSEKEAKRLRRKAFFQSQHLHSSLGKFSSDIFKILSVVGAFEYSGGGHKFCAEHFVRLKAMEEIHKLRSQISNIVQINFPAANLKLTTKLAPPTDFQLKVLKQLLTASFIDQVAVRKDRVEKGQLSGAQYANSKGVAYRALGIAEDVFIHPSSVLANVSPPEFMIYHDIVRTTRVYIKGVTVINPSWLAKLGKPILCSFSKPIRNNAGQMMVIPRFGPAGWELPAVKADDVS